MSILTDSLDDIEYHVKTINIFQFLTYFKHTHQIPEEIMLHQVKI